MRKSHFVPLLLAVVVGAAAPRPANAAVISINFDVDANGNPINAQPGFARYTAALTTLYSPLGVTFSGPAPNSGGAILNEDSNFGLNALSGENFLAFNTNPAAYFLPSGYPIGPETISFASPVNSVSIYGGDGASVTFEMQAYNSPNQLVAMDTATSAPGSYVLLSVTGSGITDVVLSAAAPATAWVFDNLTIVTPEPSTLTLAALGAAGLFMAARRRKA